MKLTVESRRIGEKSNGWAYFVYDAHGERVRYGGWYRTEKEAFRVGTEVARDEAYNQIAEIAELKRLTA